MSYPDGELIMLFLKKHAKSTATEIALHTGLKQRGVLRRALDGLDAKGVLRHTDYRVRCCETSLQMRISILQLL
jgi:predicted ArsR family transcriptional regulator